jgi:hypothetical protein
MLPRTWTEKEDVDVDVEMKVALKVETKVEGGVQGSAGWLAVISLQWS